MEEYKDDPLMDKLLRKQAHLLKESVACQGFDADMATAYFEKVLTASESTSYESHLADCSLCRTQYREFALLFDESEAASPTIQPVIQPAIITKESEPISFWTAVRVWFAGSQMRWVMPIILVVILSGTAWFLLTNKPQSQTANNNQPAQNSPVNQPQPKDLPSIEPSQGDANQGVAQNQQQNETPTNIKDQQNPEQKGNDQLAQKPVINNPEDKNSIKNIEKPNLPLPSNNNQNPDLGTVASNNNLGIDLPANTGNGKQLPPPPETTNNQSSTPDNAVAQHNPDKTLDNAQSGNSIINPAGISESRGTKKRVGSKTFVLDNKSGAWIDEQYREVGKGLPVVKLVVDSEDYRKLVKEQPKLKPYFEIGRRVIVVSNNLVYSISGK